MTGHDLPVDPMAFPEPLIALPIAGPFFAIFWFAPSLPLTMLAAAVMNFLLSSCLGPCNAPSQINSG